MTLFRTALCCLEAPQLLYRPHSGCPLSSRAATLSALILSVAGRSNGLEADGSEANGDEPAIDAAAAGVEGASPAAEGGEQWDPRPTLQQTKTQGSGALGNSAARNVVAGVVDEATGGMNAGESSRHYFVGASLLKTSWSTLLKSGQGSQLSASAVRASLRLGIGMINNRKAALKRPQQFIIVIACIVPAMHIRSTLIYVLPWQHQWHRYGKDIAFLCAKQRGSLLPATPCVPLPLRSTRSLYTAAPAVCSHPALLPATAQLLLGAVPQAQGGRAEDSEM